MSARLTAVALGARHIEEEADKLALLQNALLRRGVQGELRSDGPALLIRRRMPGMPVWVFVGYGGAYYSWQSAERRHPAGDVEGAAEVLAHYVES
ncbi:hypothetical protein DP939_04365 [Spongiactinospora rosea]|uniref:Uncharacterized protein n=2 Tax=Spongiactinospora rosea TaxID=2248750 RepID=A0A366M6P5_9ACTN|nr:hypothetical protein DP939_04365 [Spongiactinospora rosea]